MSKENLILRSPYLQCLLAQLFPRLREWSIAEWPALLAKASQVEFDGVEQVATLLGVILLAWQVKPPQSLGALEFSLYLNQFIYLIPLLVLLLGPFFVRRIRRGLNLAAQSRDRAVEEKNGK